MNGVLLTGGSSGNLIGGQAVGINNPTGSKVPANAVFQTPPQGNLISGNLANGVLINGAATGNLLSGNFIGTDWTGKLPLGNGQDGVAIANANNNSLIGCTFYENPFAFYNGIAGNQGNEVSINNSNNVAVQAKTGPLSLINGGALRALAAGRGIISSKSITLNAGGGTFIADAGTTSTLSTAIRGAGSLTKDGPGTLALTGNNIYAGHGADRRHADGARCSGTGPRQCGGQRRYSQCRPAVNQRKG
jgi:hypothetical protein